MTVNEVCGKQQVYIIAAGEAWVRGEVGPLKIGLAKDIGQRLKELSTGNHEKLMVIGWLDDTHVHPQNVETRTHRALKAHRLQGEWFAVTPKQAFDALCSVVGFADFYLNEAFARQVTPRFTREMEDQIKIDGECCLQVPIEDGYFDDWPDEEQRAIQERK